jgi:hypothetical protein
MIAVTAGSHPAGIRCHHGLKIWSEGITVPSFVIPSLPFPFLIVAVRTSNSCRVRFGGHAGLEVCPDRIFEITA